MKDALKNGVTHPITSCLAAMLLVITSWLWRSNVHFEMEDPTNWVVPILGIATFVALGGVVFNAALNQIVSRLEKTGGPIIGQEAQKQHVPQIAGFMLFGFLTTNIPGVREAAHHVLETELPIHGRITFEFAMEIFSVLAVVLMIHMSALETELEELLKNIGWASLIALLGVVVPGGLYYAFVRIYAPNTPFVENFGWGVLIVATSMGIAGVILKQMGVISSKTAQIILAVAAIDDILGLAALTSWQSAAASHGNVNGGLVAILMAKNLIFMALAFVAGAGLAPYITKFVARFAREKTLAILLSLTSSSLFGVMAQCWGLSVLAGVYAGGAFLTSVMFADFGDERHSKHKLEELLEPYRAVMLPVFFIMIGRKVSLEALGDMHTWVMALAGASCLMIGKLVSVAFLPKGVDRRTMFWGLLPRGEVLLVIASMVSRAMNPQQATVIMVVAVLLIVGSTIAGSVQVPKSVARARANDPHIFDSVNGNSH